MEDLGFFGAGEGFKAVANGETRLDGPKPINTSGGLKCKGHPVGATGISQLYEVWTQLRGKAGKRQVPKKNLQIGAAHNLGGTGGTCTFTILERRRKTSGFHLYIRGTSLHDSPGVQSEKSILLWSG